MDEAARCRRAALEVLRDISPDRLHDVATDIVRDGSMAPGAVTLATARTVGDGSIEGVARRAAGVQLSYDGLRVTRDLVQTPPWPDAENTVDPDLDVLAADVLVSRGFYLLVRTDAVTQAVELVRAFGADQTRRRDPDADVEKLDANLERRVFRLAVTAGATAMNVEPPEDLLSAADRVGGTVERPLPPADRVLTEFDGLAASDPPTSRPARENRNA